MSSSKIIHTITEAKADPAKAWTPNQVVQRDRAQTLEHQYGGEHAGKWVDRLPASWIPFIQLARLSPPVGILMAHCPYFFGSILGGIATHTSLHTICLTDIILVVCSMFASNYGHTWNDLTDESFDRAVTRTRKRPIPRGAISRHSALLFAASQFVGWVSVTVLFLPRGSVLYLLPNLAAVTYYPFAKRHTHFAQVVLGFCLGWSVFMGSVSVGHEPFALGALRLQVHHEATQSSAVYTTFGNARVDLGIVSLFMAIICWMVISDTVYAHQDLKDDLVLGLKSMAVLLQDRTKQALGVPLAGMVVLLAYCGVWYNFGILYQVLTPAACLIILGTMLLNIDLKESSSCWWWFQHAFWGVQSCIAMGLMVGYFLSFSST